MLGMNNQSKLQFQLQHPSSFRISIPKAHVRMVDLSVFKMPLVSWLTSSLGAQFIVAPCFNPDVVRWCKANAVPVFPGVATASEVPRKIMNEREAGERRVC